jgi:hypothetical protein
MNEERNNLDGATPPTLTDSQVEELYANGFISRAEADVFDSIARFEERDDQERHAMPHYSPRDAQRVRLSVIVAHIINWKG